MLDPVIVVIKSSELFKLALKHMKEEAVEGGGASGDGDLEGADTDTDSGLVPLPNIAGWEAKLAKENADSKMCEHCRRHLYYKPKFSIVWESVRWCSYNCKLEACGGGECDNTELLLNNKKYKALVGCMIPNNLAETTQESGSGLAGGDVNVGSVDAAGAAEGPASSGGGGGPPATTAAKSTSVASEGGAATPAGAISEPAVA